MFRRRSRGISGKPASLDVIGGSWNRFGNFLKEKESLHSRFIEGWGDAPWFLVGDWRAVNALQSKQVFHRRHKSQNSTLVESLVEDI